MTIPTNAPAVLAVALLAFVALFIVFNWKGRQSG